MNDDHFERQPPPSGSRSGPPRPANYEVGHGRPPKNSRWPKGRSGNPGGRRKDEPINLLVSFKGILDETVSNRSGGRAVTKRELMVRGPLFQQAMRCNQRAFRRFLKLAKQAGLLKELKLPWEQAGGNVYAPLGADLMQKLGEFRRSKAADKLK